jgi:hypothetical protein
MALSLCLPACSGIVCSNQTVASLKSPDGKHRAILFMRECGATTDYTTQVSVVNSWWPFHGIGNAFVADAYDSGAKRGSWGGPWAQIAWASPQQLLVTYDGRSRVFTQNVTATGVRVTYRAVRQ